MLLKFWSKAVAFGLYDILFWQARNHLSPPSPAPSFMVLLTYTKLRSSPLFIFFAAQPGIEIADSDGQ